MLELLRRKTKLILWITVASFVLLIFLVWGADLQFGGKRLPNEAGTVNGATITNQEYQQELASLREGARRGGQEVLPSQELQIEEQAWNNIVQRRLLMQEAAKRHLLPKDSEVRAALLYDPPSFIQQIPAFQKQGKFDMATYRAILTNPDVPVQQIIGLEDEVRSYLPLEKIQNLIVSAAKVTDDELRRTYLEQNQKAKVTYVLVDAGRIPAGARPTDAELKSYYDQHQSDYRLPERVTLDYVTLPRQATAADSAALLSDLRGLASEARLAAEAKAAGREDVEHSDFETLVESFSDGPNADKGGLSPGYLTPEEMSQPMQRAVQGLGKGEIGGPYKDGGYFHLVQVVDAKEDKDKGETSVQIRDLAMRIAPSDSTVNEVRDRLDAVRDEAANGGLGAAAAAHGLKVMVAKDVTLSGIVPGLAAIPQVTQFAFESPKGTLSRVMATNNSWFLVEVGEHTPAGVPPLEEIKDRVRNDLLHQQSMDAVKARAQAIAAAAKAGKSLEDAAAEDSLSAVTTPDFTRRSGVPGLGRDPDVVGAAFGLPVGEVSDPLKATRGWVVMKVDDRPDVDWSGFDKQKEQLRQSLLAVEQSRIFNAWLEDLRKSAKIRDYRS